MRLDKVNVDIKGHQTYMSIPDLHLHIRISRHGGVVMCNVANVIFYWLHSVVSRSRDLASDWLRLFIWPGYWPLIGREWSRDKDTGLWLTERDYLILILASEWLRVITWPEYWPLIGLEWPYDTSLLLAETSYCGMKHLFCLAGAAWQLNEQ